MFASEILEIVIGLVFIYLILSLLGTTINELVAGILNSRGKILKKSLKLMLQELDQKADVFHKFETHPVFIKLRRSSETKYPSYLSAAKFSKILTESIMPDGDSDQKETLGEAIAKIPGNTGKVLQSYWDEVSGDINAFKRKMEEWFDEVQARATGWYKRNVQKLLLLIGFLIALSVNADTLGIVNKLSKDSKARKSLVELAISQSEQLESEYFDGNDTGNDIEKLHKQTQKLVNDQLASVDHIMGMGWNTMIDGFNNAKTDGILFTWFLKKLFGLILTAFAISLGANFWFDLLNKAINIRNSGGLPTQGKEDKSKKTDQA